MFPPLTILICSNFTCQTSTSSTGGQGTWSDPECLDQVVRVVLPPAPIYFSFFFICGENCDFLSQPEKKNTHGVFGKTHLSSLVWEQGEILVEGRHCGHVFALILQRSLY